MGRLFISTLTGLAIMAALGCEAGDKRLTLNKTLGGGSGDKAFGDLVSGVNEKSTTGKCLRVDDLVKVYTSTTEKDLALYTMDTVLGTMEAGDADIKPTENTAQAAVAILRGVKTETFQLSRPSNERSGGSKLLTSAKTGKFLRVKSLDPDCTKLVLESGGKDVEWKVLSKTATALSVQHPENQEILQYTFDGVASLRLTSYRATNGGIVCKQALPPIVKTSLMLSRLASSADVAIQKPFALMIAAKLQESEALDEALENGKTVDGDKGLVLLNSTLWTEVINAVTQGLIVAGECGVDG